MANAFSYSPKTTNSQEYKSLKAIIKSINAKLYFQVNPNRRNEWQKNEAKKKKKREMRKEAKNENEIPQIVIGWLWKLVNCQQKYGENEENNLAQEKRHTTFASATTYDQE